MTPSMTPSIAKQAAPVDAAVASPVSSQMGGLAQGPCYQRLSRDRFGAGLYWQPLGRVLGGGAGLARVNPETGRILTRVPIPSRTIESLAQDRVGRIWIGTFDGLVRVDPRTDEITAQTFRLPSNRVLALALDGRGFLWAGTDRGLVMLSPDQGLIMTTVQDLPGVSANAMAVDRQNNLWVGTPERFSQGRYGQRLSHHANF